MHLFKTLALVCAAVIVTVAPVAQTIPAIGTDATLDVATWNIENFGDPNGGPSNDDLQRQNVQAVMEGAEIDLWALQELSDEATFNTLLADLGDGWDGVRIDGFVGYGYIYKTDVIETLQISQILTGFSYEFAQRPPLLLRANVVLPDTTIEVRFIDVHMKCCWGQEEYDRRVAASAALKNYVDNLIFIDEHVIILGDLNDELILSFYQGRTSPYRNFLDDSDYFFMTESFDMSGTSQDTFTYCSNAACSNGSVFDHIIATSNLQDDYQPGSIGVFDELFDEITSYVSTTSDHLPVYARFNFPPTTSNENEAPDQGFALNSAYPNPFNDRATISYTLDYPTDVTLEIYDTLGRRVANLVETRMAAGSHTATLEGVTLAPGVYVVRLVANGRTASQRVIRGR